MRISDWSSDVCSSDLEEARGLLEILLGDDYARSRAAEIGDEASDRWRPGAVPGREPFLPPLISESSAQRGSVGEPTVRTTGETRGDTCHIDVVDADGNIASITPSGGWLQSSPRSEEHPS